jgi:hypothetical protein
VALSPVSAVELPAFLQDSMGANAEVRAKVEFVKGAL